MIPRIDLAQLAAGDADAVAGMHKAATDVGFAKVHNTALDAKRVSAVIETYRSFFKLPEAEKSNCDMAKTGSNRGWGAAGSEQVDPDANPDYKQFFDAGLTLPDGDPRLSEPFYAPNCWPSNPPEFEAVIRQYYTDACAVAMDVLRGVARAVDLSAEVFEGAFDAPMALLRGNYYPARPAWAGSKDFGIATHTDYGCLTLLATDGSPGLEVRKRGGGWIPLSAAPGEFIINFGEMMEFWSDGLVRATPHRVVGGNDERISVPLFFNPAYDTNVAPEGADRMIKAGEHLAARYNETYVHLQKP
ncbi:2OG-Fe(II) oxygenase [Sulfitobacter noctilucicola]|uniref:2-oxoglutarate-dependent ethylene/succinate-forming enzyme n=1 Tax=Sulfitobacter noctilucicola TaxID=1342301 RepID=A0A7W6MBX6_9RHOB|nr:2-oxoglutarate and iron-dependent oxygenase domain-containing protein [Sulfitobacter noctilucicola]KIN66379.1 2OG-Fe(II) oxygenase [Sulfitobacter noctilucicola]MBB4175728.1 isopenicillin N synthase-like dioxygenase [Sulfitobacter noctilucicola]